ncbi:MULTISPECIES: hypothetical protein [Chryseobacterium]|uniref:hypothetical protein n=1 Tax=Chryseobacterium TaxID=59732 RepID=UPI001552197A|nr:MULTISPECIES: hypothetical protein [unclassified Chryseobacterium]MDC8103476.1 hypothetical protein [Chryseobacterium sp. B21-037]MDQ1803029.1 hypothetical protein [Chryseobacterium sp. CKR4-1]WBV57006.1 hypothetical protein PFY10_00945 [Chryseobacterium daecheongense]
MQGIEPKIHQEVIKRINDLEQLLKQSPDQDRTYTDEIVMMNTELSALYEEYLSIKKRLETCIKLYRSRHIEIRKHLTHNIRKIKRERVNRK